jgi:uncharacterized protein
MGSEFDPAKDAANIAKHGISLAEGDGVVRDPLGLTREDDSAEGEQRWVTIGMNTFGELRVAVWTQRGEHARLISVRKPTSQERKHYES